MSQILRYLSVSLNFKQENQPRMILGLRSNLKYLVKPNRKFRGPILQTNQGKIWLLVKALCSTTAIPTSLQPTRTISQSLKNRIDPRLCRKNYFIGRRTHHQSQQRTWLNLLHLHTQKKILRLSKGTDFSTPEGIIWPWTTSTLALSTEALQSRTFMPGSRKVRAPGQVQSSQTTFLRGDTPTTEVFRQKLP